jgi:tetratricopeptide (TPR) repeat protein
MPVPLPETSDDRERIDPAPRLVGWKEIAAYLDKADRTVKRWGRDRGLPIHRVPGIAKTSVYAYPVELDRWLESAHAAETISHEETEEIGSQGSGSVTGVPAVESSVAATVPVPPRTFWSAKRKWAIAFVAMLLIVIGIGAAIPISGGLQPTDLLSSFLAKKHRPSNSGTSLVTSDAEKTIARDYYLRGRYEWNHRTPESLHRALDLFTQAIVHDPNDAHAYAGLADTYNLLREYSTASDSEVFPRAIAAARKAVALDDSLAEAHRALAFAEMYGSWDFVDAEKEFRLAIALNPGDPQARQWYANAFAMPGRYAETLKHMDKAQELDPSSHTTLADKGWMLYNSGKTDEAIALLKEVERSAPEFRSPHFYLMLISLDLHDYPTYLSEGQLAAQSVDDPVLKDIINFARAGYKRNGDQGLLEALYTKQKEYYQAGKLRATTLAKTCALMGKKQEALKLLEQAYDSHDTDVLSCLSHPDLLTLKDEPKYQTLVRKINFPGVSAATSQQNLASIGSGHPNTKTPQH